MTDEHQLENAAGWEDLFPRPWQEVHKQNRDLFLDQLDRALQLRDEQNLFGQREAARGILRQLHIYPDSYNSPSLLTREQIYSQDSTETKLPEAVTDLRERKLTQLQNDITAQTKLFVEAIRAGKGGKESQRMLEEDGNDLYLLAGASRDFFADYLWSDLDADDIEAGLGLIERIASTEEVPLGTRAIVLRLFRRYYGPLNPVELARQMGGLTQDLGAAGILNDAQVKILQKTIGG